MATSSTAAFNPSVSQCIEEAYERCNVQLTSGMSLRTALFSLNILLSEFKNESIYEFAHLIGPIIILLFGSFILGKALYKKNHNHSDDCGHQHSKIKKSTLESPVAVGLLTGMLPCASSLAVVMMTGMNVSYLSIISFIFIYVLAHFL